MRALKALVVGMGVLLVVGVVALFIVLAGRAGGKLAPVAAGAGSDPAGLPMPPRVFGTVPLAVPAGASVAAIQAVGDRLIVHLQMSDLPDRILILDLSAGTTLGTIELRPEARP